MRFSSEITSFLHEQNQGNSLKSQRSMIVRFIISIERGTIVLFKGKRKSQAKRELFIGANSAVEPH
jgi:hypothetical protein